MTKLVPHVRSENMKLHERMQMYERRDRHYLTPKVPVIVRVDGRAFHTLTRGFHKPFDSVFMEGMAVATEQVMCEGGVLAYVQSDEASFLLLDNAKPDTMPWFDYRQDKLVSLIASKMSTYFNFFMVEERPNHYSAQVATFDARAFNIPEAEVANYFLHRAQDWGRNSVQMLARSLFPHRKLHLKKREAQLDMIRSKGLDWEELEGRRKYGTFIYRAFVRKEMPGSPEPIVVRRLVREEHIPPMYKDVSDIVDRAEAIYNARV